MLETILLHKSRSERLPSQVLHCEQRLPANSIQRHETVAKGLSGLHTHCSTRPLSVKGIHQRERHRARLPLSHIFVHRLPIFFMQADLAYTVAFLRVFVALYRSCKNLHICHGSSWWCITYLRGTLLEPCMIIGHVIFLEYSASLPTSDLSSLSHTSSEEDELVASWARAACQTSYTSESPLSPPTNTRSCLTVLQT